MGVFTDPEREYLKFSVVVASVDPWSPRGIKVRGSASIEEHAGRLRIRIEPEVIWSCNINSDAEKRFASIERWTVSKG